MKRATWSNRHAPLLSRFCLKKTVGLDKTVGRLSFFLANVRHRLANRAGVGIGFRVVMQVVNEKGISSVFSVSVFLVEVAVFDERRDAFLFQIVVVLFASIS